MNKFKKLSAAGMLTLFFVSGAFASQTQSASITDNLPSSIKDKLVNVPTSIKNHLEEGVPESVINYFKMNNIASIEKYLKTTMVINIKNNTTYSMIIRETTDIDTFQTTDYLIPLYQNIKKDFNTQKTYIIPPNSNVNFIIYPMNESSDAQAARKFTISPDISTDEQALYYFTVAQKVQFVNGTVRAAELVSYKNPDKKYSIQIDTENKDGINGVTSTDQTISTEPSIANLTITAN